MPSLNHPWSSPALWWRNIRNGNASLSSLYPRLVSIAWPDAWDTNLPSVSYYRDLLRFWDDGFAEVVIKADGYVEPVLFERKTVARIGRGEALFFDQTGFAKEANSPLNSANFECFVDMVEILSPGTRTLSLSKRFFIPATRNCGKTQHETRPTESSCGISRRSTRRFTTCRAKRPGSNSPTNSGSIRAMSRRRAGRPC